MSPTTPASTKGSNKKNKSSLSKKMKDQDTPLHDKKLSKSQKKKLKFSPVDKSIPMLVDSEVRPTPEETDDDEDMNETPIQPLTISTSALTDSIHNSENQLTTTTTITALIPDNIQPVPVNNKSASTTANLELDLDSDQDSNKDEEEDDPEIQDEDLMKIKLGPEIIDQDTEITGGHVVGGSNAYTQLNAYRKNSISTFLELSNPLLTSIKLINSIF